MPKNKKLIVGKLYSLSDYFFVYNNRQRFTGIGQFYLAKDDVIMVLENTSFGSNGVEDCYRILTSKDGVMYASHMLNHRVKIS
jgi:hypothetical protein